MKPLTYRNKKGEDIMPLHIFRKLHPDRIMATINSKRKKVKK